MSSSDLVMHATTFGLAAVTLAIAMVLLRLWLAPTLADRILALDTMTTLAMGFVCLVAIRSGVMLYLDIAIALGLVGFVSTVALARYLVNRPRSSVESARPKE